MLSKGIATKGALRKGIATKGLILRTGGGAAPAAAVFVAPTNRQVVTTATSFATAATSTGDTALSFYVGGVLNHAMVNDGNGNWTGTWNPVPAVGNYTVTLVGNNTGTSAPITVTVDAANILSQALTTAAWNKSNVAITDVSGSVQTPASGNAVFLVKPSGTTNVRPLFYPASTTGAGTIFGDGLDVWVAVPPGSVTKTFAYSDGVGTGNINIETEETAASNMYTSVVERKVVNGVTWKRVQMVRLDNASSNGTSCFWDLARTVEGYQNSTNMQVSAGEIGASGLWFCLPRRVDDVVLPFTISEKMVAYLHSVDSAALAVTGAEQWYHKSRNVDSETNMAGGPKGISIRLIFPSGYSKTAGTGKLLLILKAQTDAADGTGGNKTTWQTATLDDYANIHNVVVAVIDERPSEGYWAGKMDAGTKNMIEWYNEVWFPWMVRTQGISQTADNAVVGYSKGGNAAMNFRMKYPLNWARVGCADAAWLNAYPSNNANLSYNSAGTYNANDPYQILTANLSKFTDKARIVLTGGFAWNTDLAAMKTLLENNSVPFTYYASAWTSHNWGPTGGPNTVWTPTFIAAVMALP